MSLKEKLLGVLKSEVVEVPGLKVLVTELTVAQRLSIFKQGDGALSMDTFYPALIIAGVRDPETKEPIFKEGDEDTVLEMGFDIVELLTKKISELSGVTEKAVKDAEKNLSTTLNTTT